MDIDPNRAIELIKTLSGGNNATEYSGYEARDIRPRRKPIFQNVPDYNSKIVLGLDRPDTSFYTTLRAWVYKPNPNYPKTTLRVGFSNGNGKSYATIDLDELKQIAAFYTKCVKEITPLWKEYKPLEEELIELNKTKDEDYKNILDKHSVDVAKVIEENAEVIGD